ncbi:MAG: hypothetical protein GY854_30385 [Deltaproteobacteria bacterium]|nr:hypothetical protein [Deltaproteobacteria bacterium]
MSENLENWRKRLAHRLSTLGEGKQRVILFARSIATLDAESAAKVLCEILFRAFYKRDRPSRLTAEAAVLSLATSRWPEEHRVDAAESVMVDGDRLTYLFLRGIDSSLQPEDEDTYQVPSYYSDRQLTLGERRSIAARPNRRLIEMAMRDPHPMVALKLFDNPKLTEDDTVTIAARRPSPSAVLIELAMHPRYRTSRRVARALINNPNLPSGVALTLLPCLEIPYISQIAADHRQKPLVREAALEIISLPKKRGNFFAQSTDIDF